MAGGRRVGDLQRAERINAAAELAEAGVATGEAVRVLAERFAVSTRQARRYVDRAASGGRVDVPETSVVFTVKLPSTLAARVRERARETGSTISALVAQALTEFLARGRGGPRRP
jgi:Ribbon-helix-helix protein, copG family